jgi:hypothetical protein
VNEPASTRTDRCPLLALRGHSSRGALCLLSESRADLAISGPAFDQSGRAAHNSYMVNSGIFQHRTN